MSLQEYEAKKIYEKFGIMAQDAVELLIDNCIEDDIQYWKKVLEILKEKQQ